MENFLRTKILVRLDDGLDLLHSTERNTFVGLGTQYDDEFQLYPIEVGTVLNFKDRFGREGEHEVIAIQTLAYPKTQAEESDYSFDVTIVYYVKRLFKV